MRPVAPALLLLLLAGCVTAPAAPPAPPIPVPRAPVPGSLVGRNQAALVAQFGQPHADIQEGLGRKLQFAGPICVIDAYLYAPQGRGEPVVTHFDARQRNGGPIDPASCIAALTKRTGQP